MDYAKQLEIRSQYANVYVTKFADGLAIPWKPLSLQGFADYCADLQNNQYPPSVLEDEVFKKCVVDPLITSQIDSLGAGIVTTVVQNILAMSGPQGPESFNDDLKQARSLAFNGHNSFLNEIVYLISLAFPYKPEEVYAMEYPVLLQRLALAEYKLIKTQVLKEPIFVYDKEQAKSEPFQDLNAEPVVSRPKLDAKKLWDEQQAMQREMSQHVPQPAPNNKKWWKDSPILEAQKKHNINFESDAEEINHSLLDSHEMREPKEMRDYLIKQKTSSHVQDLISHFDEIYPGLRDKLAQKKR